MIALGFRIGMLGFLAYQCLAPLRLRKSKRKPRGKRSAR